MKEVYTEAFYAALEVNRMINEGGHVDETDKAKLAANQKKVKKERK